MIRWIHLENIEMILLPRVIILINVFLWFAFGTALQPVTFRSDLPKATLGNVFPLLDNSHCLLCCHQDFRSCSNHHN